MQTMVPKRKSPISMFSDDLALNSFKEAKGEGPAGAETSLARHRSLCPSTPTKPGIFFSFLCSAVIQHVKHCLWHHHNSKVPVSHE